MANRAPKRALSKYCDMGSFIAHHFDVLMDVFQKELNIGSHQTYTKCVYTAMTMMFLLCGDKAKAASQFCRVSNVRKRLEQNALQDRIIEKSFVRLKENILSPNPKRREVYYIMLTNASLPHASDKTKDDVMFPGHVFVIEKLVDPRHDENVYVIYQSYVNEYTLQEYMRRARKPSTPQKLKYTQAEFKTFMEQLHRFVNARVWTQEHIDFWKTFTLTDAREYRGYHIRPHILFCYQKRTATQCKDAIVKMLVEKKERGDIPSHREHQVNEMIQKFRGKCKEASCV